MCEQVISLPSEIDESSVDYIDVRENYDVLNTVKSVKESNY